MKEDFEFEKFYNEVTEFEEIKNVEKGTKRVTILFLVEVTVTFLVICILFRGNHYAIVEALSNGSILGFGLVCLIIFLVANYYALTMCKFFIVNKIVTKKFDVKLSITDFLTTDGSKEYGNSIILPIFEKRIIKKYFKEISGVYNPKSFFVRPHGFSASSLMKKSLPKEFSMQEDDVLKCYASASPEDIGVVKTYFFGNGVTKNNLNFAMLNTTHYDVNWGEVESFTGMVSVTRLPKSFDMTIYVLQNRPLYILYPRNDNKGSIFITFNKFRKTFINNTEKRTPAIQKPIFSTIFYISIHKITHAKKERRHKPAFPF